MRPQGFAQAGAGLEDLGWNDMGFEPPKAVEPALEADVASFDEDVPAHPHNLAGLTPVQSPVHDQQAEIAGRLSTYSPEDDGEEEVDETAELYDPQAEEAEESEEAVAIERAKPDPVVIQSEEPQAVAAAPAPPVRMVREPRKARTALGSKGKAAFTLRLDPERHLKLRIACAVDGRSAQQFVTQALDELLAAMPELDAMVARAKRKG